MKQTLKKKYKEKDWLLALDLTYKLLSEFSDKTEKLKVLKSKKLKFAREDVIEAMYQLYSKIGSEGL